MNKESLKLGADNGFGGIEHRALATLGDILAAEQRMFAFLKSVLGKPQGETEPMFYKPRQVAVLTGISEHTLRRKLRDRQLEGIQQAGVKGSWLIPKEAVKALLQSMHGGS